MSNKIVLELSCRFCHFEFASECTRRRHEQKQHNEEYSLCKQRGSVNLTVLTGFRRCLFCCILIKDNEEARVNHSQSKYHVYRRSLYPSFDEGEKRNTQSGDSVERFHTSTTSQSYVDRGISSTVDHELRECMYPCNKCKF